MPILWHISTPFFRPSGVLNSSHRAVYRMVPPRWMISLTLRSFISSISPLSRPSYPLRMPIILWPLMIPARITARTAAFIPGASPPLVRTPMVLHSVILSSSWFRRKDRRDFLFSYPYCKPFPPGSKAVKTTKEALC